MSHEGRRTVYVMPDGRYRLERTLDYDPELETWEFLPGSTVRCELRQLSDGPAFVAVSEN